MVRKLKRSMPKGINARDDLNDGRNPAPIMMGQREEIRLTIFVCHSAGAKPHLPGPAPGRRRAAACIITRIGREREKAINTLFFLARYQA